MKNEKMDGYVMGAASTYRYGECSIRVYISSQTFPIAGIVIGGFVHLPVMNT